MLELVINRNKEEKTIALLENGKLVEVYEEFEQENKNEGNIYIGVVKDILSGMQSAFVDIGIEKNSFIHLKDILPKIDEKNNKYDKNLNIKDVTKVNEKLIVQVKKDSNEKKGARVSTHINLTSKYVVLMPNTNIITISQKIDDDTEKQRLLNIIKQNIPKGNGAIVRTSAKGKSEEIIKKDLDYILNKWKDIEKKAKEMKKLNSPNLIYKSDGTAEKIIIDMFDKNLNKIIVNDSTDYKDLQQMLNSNEDFKNISLELRSEPSILHMYDIEKQLKKSKERKVWLNCGGFITIDKTEALTAIDVNTGKYTGGKSLEKTIYKVNEEATIEIAKQLRLRDIGGIVIIDYIDMDNEENKTKIQNLLQEKLLEDRAKTQIEGFTRLELMEMTRKHICSHSN